MLGLGPTRRNLVLTNFICKRPRLPVLGVHLRHLLEGFSQSSSVAPHRGLVHAESGLSQEASPCHRIGGCPLTDCRAQD